MEVVLLVGGLAPRSSRSLRGNLRKRQETPHREAQLICFYFLTTDPGLFFEKFETFFL